jgi:hypothetical protein
MTFTQIEANAEDTQVAAIFTIDQAAQSSFNGFATGGQQIQVQQDNGQGQAVEALHGMQAGTLRRHVKTKQSNRYSLILPFHLFYPVGVPVVKNEPKFEPQPVKP